MNETYIIIISNGSGGGGGGNAVIVFSVSLENIPFEIPFEYGQYST